MSAALRALPSSSVLAPTTALAPEDVAGVWRADQLAHTSHTTQASGHKALDAELPGGGWPQSQLCEILQPQAGLHEWRLLWPALQEATQQGALVLVSPPHLPHLPALACLGLAPQRVLRIEAQTPAERLWAAEQVLRCKDLGALLAWLPQVRSEQLRRLQLAAQSGAAAQALAFVMRPLEARHESSPAPLRVAVQCARPEGRTQLAVQLLKRRGPPHDTPLHIEAPLPVLAALRPGALQHASSPSAHAVDRPAPRRTARRLTPA